jgi:Holliday junction resolvase
MGIQEDFKTGDKAEIKVIKLLKSNGFQACKNKNKATRQFFDIVASHGNSTFTLEVKYDVYSERSGNIAIEFNNSRKVKPSGINATTADLWVQVTPKQGSWFTSVAKLKEYISTHKPFRTIISGGDGNADMYLYKADEILPAIFIRCDTLANDALKRAILGMVYNKEEK